MSLEKTNDKRFASVKRHSCGRQTSLMKKLENIRRLKEAIENAKPKLVKQKCCHMPDEVPKVDETYFPRDTSPHEEVLTDTVMRRIEALKILEKSERKKQLNRKIEIVKRLILEQQMKKKDDSFLKCRSERKESVSQYNATEELVEKIKSSQENNENGTHGFGDGILDRIGLLPGPIIPQSSHESQLITKLEHHTPNDKGKKHVTEALKDSEIPLKSLLDSDEINEGNEYCQFTKSSRRCETLSEKIRQGKVIRDNEWSSNPAEVEFKANSKSIAHDNLIEEFPDSHLDQFTFENDKPEAIYKRTVIITNTGRSSAYCGFEEVECSMLVHPYTFSGCREIKRIHPGMTMSFDLSFAPQGEIPGSLEAEAYFLTKRMRINGYLIIPISCHPIVCAEFEAGVVSTIIKKLKYWSEPVTKTILLRNTLDIPCKVHLNFENDKLSGEFEVSLRNFYKEKKTYDVDKNYGKKVRRLLSEVIAKYIFNLMFNSIFEPIQTSPRYFTEISNNSKSSLAIKFIPQLVNNEGSVLKRMTINYEIDNRVFFMNKVTINASTEGLPIVIEPHLLDFKVCIIGVCQQQTSFTIKNEGRIAIPLRVTTERILKKYITIRPNNLFVLSGSSMTVGVNLNLESEFQDDMMKFINEDLRLLEFPIYIHDSSEHRDKILPLILPAMAILTNCFALEISDKSIDFGIVTLSTSKSRQIEIVNESPLLQFYGFFNVPNDMIIEPGCGFGYIYPGEKISVDLVYSPNFQEVICGDRKNHIKKVISLCTAYSASHFNLRTFGAKIAETGDFKLNYSRDDTDEQENEVDHPRKMSDEDVPFNRVIEEDSQNTSFMLVENGKISDENEVEIFKSLEISWETFELNFGSSIYDEETNIKNENENKPNVLDRTPAIETVISSPTTNKSHSIQGGIPLMMESVYNLPIECNAVVVRPIMEFSSQRVLLQPTPCGSRSYAYVYLRDRPSDVCTCGRTSEKLKFKGRFYLTTEDESVNIQPATGNIHNDMSEKLFIEHKPTLSKQSIREKVKEIQIEAEKKLNEEIENSGKKKSSKQKKNEKNKSSNSAKSAKRTPLKDEVDDASYQEAKNVLLKTLETVRKTVVIKCKILMRLENDSVDDNESGQCVLEEIECHVVCTIIKPEFLLKSRRTVDFGMVAVGARETISIEVENISERPINLSLSHLSPIGSFSYSLRTLPIQCKSYKKIGGVKKHLIHKCSILIDPEQTHKFEIRFNPQDESEKSFERLDVEGGKTNVTLLLKALIVRNGVELKPANTYYELECGFGSQQKVDILVNSTSKAIQNLSIRRVYLKAIPLSVFKTFFPGTVVPEKEESVKSRAKSPSKKSARKQKTQNTYEEEKTFFDNYTSKKQYNLDDDMFTLSFEAVEKGKSKKGKSNQKADSKAKKDGQQTEFVDEAVVDKNKAALQPLKKYKLVPIFSLKEKDELIHDVRVTDGTSSLGNEKEMNIPDSHVYNLSMQDHKESLEKLENAIDDMDPIAFHKNMLFVAKYSIILGIETVMFNLYLVGKSKDQ